MTPDYEAQSTGIGTLDQLRDLYERVPFVRGRARAELLRRLQRVRREVRDGRLARPSARAASEQRVERLISLTASQP